MELSQILEEITAGLTGDNEKDIQYIHEQSEKYKNHEYSKEILRACGRLIFELMSDDKKEKLNRLIVNDVKGIEATIKEIRFHVFDGDIEKAFQLSEALVTKINETMMFDNDAVSEYYTFHDIFEEVLFIYYTQPTKDIRQATIPYSEIFYLHGNLLFELKRISEAREYFEKALRWNPASCTIAFEYIETYKVEGQFDKFLELTKEQFQYAYYPKDVARCYRNMGYYYIEKNEYSVAAACYVLSMLYDSENQISQSQLYYIEHTAHGGYHQPTVEMLEQYEKQYDLPRGASKDVIGLSYAYGSDALKDGELDLAIYFFEIFYGLTNDEDTLKLLTELKEKVHKEQ